MTIFDAMESAVRTYCRRFPAVFTRASGHRMWDEQGREYMDFLSGAGALNYGHNPPEVRAAVVDYLLADGPVHGLDLHTTAKAAFLERFQDVVLAPGRWSTGSSSPAPPAPMRSRRPSRPPGG